MSPSCRRLTLILSALSCLALILGCSLPERLLRGGPLAPPSADGLFGEPQPGSPDGPGEPAAAAEPLVVTFQGDSFLLYSLEGSQVDTRPADGLGYPRPNTAQVVGESIYYVDSAGSSLGGVVRRVTAQGVEALDFTAAEDLDTLTFAVSDDETRIAWTHSFLGQASSYSKLYVAGIDGRDPELIVELGPPYDQPGSLLLEAVGWLGGDPIYAYQVTGIGGYILFFGWSSFYRYDTAAGSPIPLVPSEEAGNGPCWYDVSPDGERAVGGCGPEGMGERVFATGGTTTFPSMPDQGQQGGAAYSPSGQRLAYAIARGNPDDEMGQALVRLDAGDDPTPIASQSPGFFSRLLWVDEERMAAGVYDGSRDRVDLLGVDGARSEIGGGLLIGLMKPAAVAATDKAGDDLSRLVDRGDLEIVTVTANGEIAGPGITVEVYNPGPDDIVTTIPCGFIFMPDDGGDQRLMVVQPATAAVPAGGSATVTAYVVCIDSHSDTPDDGAGYTLGTMQSGQLLQLAHCACQVDLASSLNPFEGMGVMTAGWIISEGKTFSEMTPEDSGGAMGDLFGPDGGQAFSGMMGLLEKPAMGWFDRCQIPVP